MREVENKNGVESKINNMRWVESKIIIVRWVQSKKGKKWWWGWVKRSKNLGKNPSIASYFLSYCHLFSVKSFKASEQLNQPFRAQDFTGIRKVGFQRNFFDDRFRGFHLFIFLFFLSHLLLRVLLYVLYGVVLLYCGEESKSCFPEILRHVFRPRLPILEGAVKYTC